MIRLFPRTVLRACLLVVTTILATSCSQKIIYNNLDIIISSYIDDYVSLDDALEKKADQRIIAILKWHRQTQLNEYAQWLRAVQGDINHELTSNKLEHHFTTIEKFWLTTLTKANEEMAAFLPSLNKNQRDELFDNLADKNKAFREDYIDIDHEDQLEKYVDSTIDNYSTWLGDLTSLQQTAIEKAAAQLQSTAELRYKQRLLWQQTVKRILYSDKNNKAKSQALLNYFSDYAINIVEPLKSINEKNRKIIIALTIRISQSMTGEQKAHFIDTTNDYIRMFEELARQQ